MTQPVRQVNPWTVGGGGRIRELFPLPPWAIVAGRFAGWWLRHPAQLATLTVGIAAAMHWRSWKAGLAATTLLAVLAVTGWLAWTGRRGSAAGVRAIVTGVARMRKVRRRWPQAAHAAGITARGDTTVAPPLRDVRITQTGIRAVAITGVVGKHAREVVKASDTIAASMFCDRVIARPLNPSVVSVRFDWGAHLHRTYRLADLPAPSARNRVVYGIREDGLGAELVFNLSTLVVGSAGSGKSSLAWSYLAGLIRSGIPMRVRVLDPGRVEFDALRRALESGKSPIAHQYVRDMNTLKGKGGLWEQLDRALEARLAAVEAAGRREHVPTPDEPLDVLIIDELLPLARDLRSEGVSHVVGKIAFLGRKAGFVVMALSQAGQVDAIGRVRDLFPQRLCLRALNRAMVDAALGDGAASDGARCQDLDVDHDRGVGYSAADGQCGYEAFRAAWVPDLETKTLALGRMPAAQAERGALSARETSLYRLYDAGDRLLYVGIAADVDRRMGEHAKSKAWWPQVARHVVETYPDRDLAETAEALAIRSELPLHNDKFNGDNPGRVPARRFWRRSDGVIVHDAEADEERV